MKFFTEKPVVFAFTDCKDANAITRLTARLESLFVGSSIHAFGIDKDIEANGCILDTLDALRESSTPAVMIGNLAPRSDKSHKNGAPFYVARSGSTVIATTKSCVALLAKLGLLDSLEETDVETVCRVFLPEAEALRIANSQFRSFEYLPRLALWAHEGKKFPTTVSAFPTLASNCIWWIDNFGNAKTTITESELKAHVVNNTITLTINGTVQTLPFYQRLADVPKDGNPACIIGSSGYNTTRFAEIVIQGKSASAELGLASGMEIVL